MKKSILVVIIALFAANISLLRAEDLLPSQAYYKNHIAVNEVSATSPVLRDVGDTDDDGPGGEGEGDSGHVGSPIGSAIAPVLAASLCYGAFLLFRKRRSEMKH
jgi:hypothetical protein